MKVILVPSVPHTGSRFLVQLLKEHPGIDHACEIQVMRKEWQVFYDPISRQNGLIPGKVNVFEGHIAHENIRIIQLFAATCSTVIPLRDPLLSLITAERCGRDHFKILEAWADLATKIDLFFEPFYVPVDLLAARPAHERHDKIAQLELHCGIETGFEDVNLDRWIDEWASVNGHGSYPLKEAYLAGDVDQVKLTLPIEYNILKRLEPLLRPLLEREGYRDLPWYD